MSALLALIVSLITLNITYACVKAPEGIEEWLKLETTTEQTNDIIKGKGALLLGEPQTSQGLVGSSVTFEKAYVKMIADALKPRSAFTIEFWFRSRDGTAGYLVDYHEPNWLFLSVYIDSQSFFTLATGHGDRLARSKTNITVDMEWHHCAVVMSEFHSSKLYLDGIHLGDYGASVSGGRLSASPQHLYIGAAGNAGAETTNHFDGAIDEVSVYTRALDAKDIQDIYNEREKGKCIPCLGDAPVGAVCNDTGEWIVTGDVILTNVTLTITSSVTYTGVVTIGSGTGFVIVDQGVIHFEQCPKVETKVSVTSKSSQDGQTVFTLPTTCIDSGIENIQPADHHPCHNFTTGSRDGLTHVFWLQQRDCNASAGVNLSQNMLLVICIVIGILIVVTAVCLYLLVRKGFFVVKTRDLATQKTPSTRKLVVIPNQV
mmetsp:Transcript_24922/g.27730  ORF Transcript_24922/g.27730 Transcript_24922/m.27730 type:complete len:430 (+) Transcript_24922:58-1347(+)